MHRFTTLFCLLAGIGQGIHAYAQDTEYDLMLAGVKCASKLFQCGDPIGITGTIKNLGETTCTDPVIRYSINDGEMTGECTVKATLAYGKSTPFAIRIPTSPDMTPATLNIDFEVVPAQGVQDVEPDDNTATISGLVFEEHPFIQRMVVEEGTGAWCGNCVRGIVGMEQMAQQFPERFIGIAVHNGDSYVNKTYDEWMVPMIDGNYPNCLVNRDGQVRDPSFSVMNTYMRNTLSKMKAELEVRPVARYEDGTIYVDADCYVGTTSTNRKLYAVFVLTEDKCPGVQSNYYAGGGMGSMGGFENQPSKAPVLYADVARGAWPSIEGSSECALPANIEAGKTYTVSMGIKESEVKRLADENLYAVAMIVDASTRTIVNAGRCAIYGMSADATEGMHSVLRPAAQSEGAYNLAGQRLNAATKGLRIEGGRKVIL